MAGPQLFHVCQACVRPDRRTAGGRAVGGGMGVNVGGGCVGVDGRVAALVAVWLAAGRVAEAVAAAVEVAACRACVAVAEGSGKGWMDWLRCRR